MKVDCSKIPLANKIIFKKNRTVDLQFVMLEDEQLIITICTSYPYSYYHFHGHCVMRFI